MLLSRLKETSVGVTEVFTTELVEGQFDRVGAFEAGFVGRCEAGALAVTEGLSFFDLLKLCLSTAITLLRPGFDVVSF